VLQIIGGAEYEGTCWTSFTYKMEEAAADFVVRVGVGIQQLLHHGQEVLVDGQDLLRVGEQDLERGARETQNDVQI